MSDSFSIDFSSDNPWMKLYAFLLYRESCKGIWLDISPKDWDTFIFDYGTSVKVDRYWDSGGGQSDGLRLDMHKYDEQLHDFSCSYYINGSKVYMEHLADVVSYMKSYMSDPKNVTSFNNFERTFGVSHDMIPTVLSIVAGHSISGLFFAAKLMAVMYEADQEGEPLNIIAKTYTAKEIKALKGYAFLAWLDMERRNYTGC